MTVLAASASPLAGLWDGPVIDADVHIAPESPEAVFPHLHELWREFARERGFADGTWNATSLSTTHPPNAPTTVHRRWREERPGTSVERLREHVLDPYRVDAAVATCSYGVDALRHPDYSAAFAAALNDWVIAEWLERDDRLRASIVLPAHDPAAMAVEIDRVGGHPGFVQVFLPVRSAHLYGRRLYLPMLEAAARAGLVLGLHAGGSTDGPPTPVGFPSWYVEEYAAAPQLFFAQMTSLIAEGVFERFPQLKVAVFESGFLWLPGILWRLDKEWKGLRRDIPWVKRPPSQLVREHFRFSVAPVDAGPADRLAVIVDHLGSEDMLMFATDYPHDQGDQLATLLRVIPPAMVPKVMHGTARDLYGLGG